MKCSYIHMNTNSRGHILCVHLDVAGAGGPTGSYSPASMYTTYAAHPPHIWPRCAQDMPPAAGGSRANIVRLPVLTHTSPYTLQEHTDIWMYMQIRTQYHVTVEQCRTSRYRSLFKHTTAAVSACCNVHSCS